MRKNEHIVLIVLGAMAVGFGVSLPFAHSFAGGLCASATMAGLIGGLADWFAVSAIFTKPLGISFKTDLIVANRERLAQGVGKMVGEELLSPQAVDGFLAKRDLATMAVLLFDRMNGKRYLRYYLTQIAERMLAAVDIEVVAHLAGDAVRKVGQTVPWRDRIREVIDELADSDELKRAGAVCLREVRRIAESEQVYTAFVEVSSEALAVYERDSAGRQMACRMMDLSPERCGETVRQALVTYLTAEEKAQHGAYWLGRALSLAVMQSDDRTILQGAQWAESYIKDRLEEMRQTVRTSPESVGWLTEIIRYAQGEVDALILDRKKNEAFNRRVRAGVVTFLSSHQSALSHLAERGVAGLSDRELTGFLRAKVGHDLQMIRVNGSLVGALVGAGLYLVRYACKAVML